jgi:transposase
MIALPNGVRVLIATRPVDFRKGMDGLAALVKEHLRADPYSGAIFVFRAKRAQQTTFRIQFAIRDDRIPLASAVRADIAGLAVPARQGFEVHLHRRAARPVP